MLKGYDPAAATALILGRMNPEEYVALPWADMPHLLSQCIEADFAYMLANDVMRKDGSDGERYYNKETAFFFIAETLLRMNRLTGAQTPEICALVDDFMDYNRSYLELNGLRYHEDERLSRENWNQ